MYCVGVCWDHLAESPVRLVLNFNQIPKEAGAIERTTFSASIVNTTICSRGRRISFMCRDCNPQHQWWALKVRDAVRLKKESYQAWLAFWLAKCAAAWAVWGAKTQVWRSLWRRMTIGRSQRNSGKPFSATIGG